jgi:hypothetical protein
MGITFHCEHCGNKITAKDESAGKWGVCPACHNKLYIPDLNVEADDLKLAPIDESEEEKRKRLMEETHRLRLDILSIKDEMKAAAQTGPVIPATPISDKQLEKRIISYLRKMVDGKLDQAKELEKQIIIYGRQAINILDEISVSEMPAPELTDIPQAVLIKIIKNLREKIF